MPSGRKRRIDVSGIALAADGGGRALGAKIGTTAHTRRILLTTNCKGCSSQRTISHAGRDPLWWPTRAPKDCAGLCGIEAGYAMESAQGAALHCDVGNHLPGEVELRF